MAKIEVKGFKGYSEKSKAKRGLAAYGDLAIAAADQLIHMGDDGTGTMKWGFVTEQAEAARDGRDWQMMDQKRIDEAQGKVDDAGVQAAEIVSTMSADEKFGAAVNAAKDENELPVSVNPFGGLVRDNSVPTIAQHQTTAKGTTARQRDVRYTIEKDRPEANGVKRPSEGGICRQIWDSIDAEKAKAKDGKVPTLKHMKAVLQHLDMTTVSVQYYRWRKFQGIAGRIDSAA